MHAAFRTRYDDTAEESGVGNARIGAYLNMIGLPLDAITYIATAPPDDFLPITPAIARNLGIEVYEQQESETTITPEMAPTAHVLARRTGELMGIATQCTELLQLDPQAIREAAVSTLKEGHAEFGGERMGAIISWMSPEVRADFERDGYSSWCFETAYSLHAEGLSFGFNGPSFDCARASSVTEHHICDDPKLWGPDRAIAALYTDNRDRATPELKTQLRDTQRSWIAWRDGCGADTECVAEAYRQRLKNFGLE